MERELIRCSWCGNGPLYQKYHDEEWGVPKHNDQVLFELLILEGAQAGLSWITILKRRENYRKAFNNFEVQQVAQFTEKDVERLTGDTGIIRNKLKIKSAIKNAQVFLKIQEEFGSFSHFFWSYVNHTPIENRYKTGDEIPASTPLSEQISKDLKKRGMSFVGPVIIYAYMQSTGMVNDHIKSCFTRDKKRN